MRRPIFVRPVSDAECEVLEDGLPSLHAWSENGQPSRLIEKSVAKDDPDPKAISCYGL